MILFGRVRSRESPLRPMINGTGLVCRTWPLASRVALYAPPKAKRDQLSARSKQHAYLELFCFYPFNFRGSWLDLDSAGRHTFIHIGPARIIFRDDRRVKFRGSSRGRLMNLGFGCRVRSSNRMKFDEKAQILRRKFDLLYSSSKYKLAKIPTLIFNISKSQTIQKQIYILL